MEDVRLAMELGDSYLGQVPIIASQISNSRFLDAPGVEELNESFERSAHQDLYNGNGTLVSGPQERGNARGNVGSGWNISLDEKIGDLEGWEGGEVQDVEALDDVLDACLAVGV